MWEGEDLYESPAERPVVFRKQCHCGAAHCSDSGELYLTTGKLCIHALGIVVGIHRGVLYLVSVEQRETAAEVGNLGQNGISVNIGDSI